MVFVPPSWVPKLPVEPPDSIPICDFMLDEQWGRRPFAQSRSPFQCGISGLQYSIEEVRSRVGLLARALATELLWESNQGSEWEKVVGVFSVNTVCMFNT